MPMRWGSLLDVFAVALASTVAVVVLVALALIGLSARAPTRPAALSPVMGRTLAGACLGAATAIVLFGLWAIVAR